MEFEDKNGRILKNGDVFDLHQTVNGCSKFIMLDINKLSVVYSHNNEPYEYDVLQMLKPCPISGTVDWEIVGNVVKKSLSKKDSVVYFKDGAAIRLHNKRIVFRQKEGKTVVHFRFADVNADIPACGHKCHKGKVRETFIQMNDEAMESLVRAYMLYKSHTKNQ